MYVKVKDNMAAGLPADVTTQQKEEQQGSSAVGESVAVSVEVEEYRAKMAEKRRLAREKAELEAAQEEQRLRQQQSVACSVLRFCSFCEELKAVLL